MGWIGVAHSWFIHSPLFDAVPPLKSSVPQRRNIHGPTHTLSLSLSDHNPSTIITTFTFIHSFKNQKQRKQRKRKSKPKLSHSPRQRKRNKSTSPSFTFSVFVLLLHLLLFTPLYFHFTPSQFSEKEREFVCMSVLWCREKVGFFFLSWATLNTARWKHREEEGYSLFFLPHFNGGSLSFLLIMLFLLLFFSLVWLRVPRSLFVSPFFDLQF